ncbi:MAG: hypothetical protein ACREKS_16685 [Candidatus Rokuibacteriota bacterium]
MFKQAIILVGCVLGLAWLGSALVRQGLRQHVSINGRVHYLLGDDAMISMRYAYNLAHGHGLVWNTGEYVEGITNLGWTLVMVLPHWLGASIRVAPLVVMILNACLHVGLVALVLVWGWRRGRMGQAVTAGALIGLDAPMLIWGSGGFETTLQALFVTAAILPFLDDDRNLGGLAPLWAALAVVIRPDSLLVFGWVAVLVTVRVARARSGGLLPLGAGVIIVGTLFLFQRSYYGEWLPNTFHLKATSGGASLTRGLAYVGDYALSLYGAPLLLAPVIYVAWKRRLAWVATLPIAWTAYVIAVGGDAFCCGRFFVPMVPTLALFAGALIRDVLMARRWLAAAALAGSFAVPAVGGGLTIPHLGYPQPQNVAGATLAAKLQERVSTSATIGVYYAGTVPYHMPAHRFHDFLGKSDRVIAASRARPGPPGHNKWDYQHSLERIRPDVIVTAGPFGRPESEYQHQLAAGEDWGFHPALWLHPVFQGRYRRVLLGPDDVHWVYVREGR